MRIEITQLVNVVVILFLIQFIFSIINSILFAFQKPAYSSLIVTSGQVLSFCLVLFFIFVLKTSSLFILGLIISISPIIILLSFTLYLFIYKYREYAPNFRYIDFSYLKDILGLGFKFFILQIITIVLFQTCNIIIAHNIDQIAVTEYNIIYKYIGLIQVIFSIIVVPYWSASTEAYVKNDFNWIKMSVKKLNLIWLCLSIFGVILVIVSPFIYKIWLRGTIVLPDYLTLWLALLYFVILIRYSIYGYILNGIGALHIQLIITSFVAIIFIPLTILFATKFRLNGVFLSLIITAFINASWSYIQYKKIIERKATGIWLK